MHHGPQHERPAFWRLRNVGAGVAILATFVGITLADLLIYDSKRIEWIMVVILTTGLIAFIVSLLEGHFTPANPGDVTTDPH
jgi:hypothetical protein